MTPRRAIATTLFGIMGLTGSAYAEDKPTRPEQVKMLAGITEYAANYTRNLPNFTATQIIQRLTQSLSQPPGLGQKQSVIEEQLSIVDHRETHKVVKLDGKMVSALDEASLGDFSRGEFGNLMAAIFSPGAGGAFTWNRTATLNGQRTQVFNFKIPAAAGYELQELGRTLRSAYQGQAWADPQTNAVLRVQLTCINIPAKSTYQALDLMVEYKATEVAGKTYILPARSLLRLRTDGGTTEINSEYKSYRRFAAESELVFGDEADSAKPANGPPPASSK